jgi:hypothetical protein
MHPRHSARARSMVGALILTLLVMVVPASAMAATSSATFVYTGSDNNSQTLFDTGLRYIDGCSHGALAVFENDPILCLPDDFPGTVWFRVLSGVDSTVVTAQSAAFTLDSPDSPRQDSTASFTSTLSTVDAAGKEVTVKTTPFVQFDIAYDAPPANCPKSTVVDLSTNSDGLYGVDTSGCLNIVYHSGHLGLGTFTLLAQDTTLPYTGVRNLSQTESSPSLDIGALAGLPSGLLGTRLDFTTKLALTAVGGFEADRQIASSSAPGTPLLSGAISWPDANPRQDDVTLPCSTTPGDSLLYKLANNRWDGHGKADSDVSLVITNPIDDISIPLVGATVFNSNVLASAPDYTKTVGTVLAENKPPTVALGTIPTDGVEGTPIHLTVVGTGPSGAFDNCDPSGSSLSFHWVFDDGSSAFGKSVYHAWNDNNGPNAHSGHVDVTDAAGNSTGLDFSVPVANGAPFVTAGPATTAAWNRPVAFNGSAVDPGSGDQGTLTYSWSFGDGTPSATGGPSVLHSYSMPNPNPYTATLTVCDKDGACTSADRSVTIRKRDVTLGYLGSTSGTFDTSATFSASLVDEFGSAVNGRSIGFTVGSESEGSPATNSGGVASVSNVTELVAGSYTATASFAGDSMYLPAVPNASSFVVSQKGTTLTYTGALTGGPNKTIILSAKLVDATGKPLANRRIDFTLGTQTKSAITDGGGVASTSIQLNQKNGTYALTATYTPLTQAPAENTKYLGNVASATFKLQAK